MSLLDGRWDRIVGLLRQCETEAMSLKEAYTLFQQRLAEHADLHSFFHTEIMKAFALGEKEATMETPEAWKAAILARRGS
jgi:hypothetical protein